MEPKIEAKELAKPIKIPTLTCPLFGIGRLLCSLASLLVPFPPLIMLTFPLPSILCLSKSIKGQKSSGKSRVKKKKVSKKSLGKSREKRK